MPPDLLSIAIPTFNRADILVENLERMLPALLEHRIPVYVSDDSPNLETRERLDVFRRRFPLLSYRHNGTALGHDRNCLATLLYPDSAHVWYLGDSLYYEPEGFAGVLEAIREGPEFVFLNCNSVTTADRSMRIPDLRPFLVRNAWYLTLTGATIYSRNVLDWYGAHGSGRMYRNFQQLGIIMEYAASQGGSGFWVNDRHLRVHRRKRSYWHRDVLTVLGRDWIDLVESFEAFFGAEETADILKSHSRNHRYYHLPGLLAFRAEGGISRSIVSENRRQIRKTTDTPLMVFWLMGCLPRAPLLALRRVLGRGRDLIGRWNRRMANADTVREGNDP